MEDGFAQIQVQPSINPLTRDGDTITLTLGRSDRNLELDTDGIFKEENFAIAPADPTSAESVAQAIPRGDQPKRAQCQRSRGRWRPGACLQRR